MEFDKFFIVNCARCTARGPRKRTHLDRNAVVYRSSGSHFWKCALSLRTILRAHTLCDDLREWTKETLNICEIVIAMWLEAIDSKDENQRKTKNNAQEVKNMYRVELKRVERNVHARTRTDLPMLLFIYWLGQDQSIFGALTLTRWWFNPNLLNCLKSLSKFISK